MRNPEEVQTRLRGHAANMDWLSAAIEYRGVQPAEIWLEADAPDRASGLVLWPIRTLAAFRKPAARRRVNDELHPPVLRLIASAINEFKRDVESRDRKQKTTDDLKETWNRRTAIGVFIYTGLTAIITVAAILQSCEAGRSTDAANRAWLGPMQLNLLQPIESLPSRMQLHVINFGREPANGVVWKMTPTVAPYLEDDARGPSDEKKMGVNNSTCDGLHPSTSRTGNPISASSSFF